MVLHVCFSGTGQTGQRDAEWLTEAVAMAGGEGIEMRDTSGDGVADTPVRVQLGNWRDLGSITIGDSIACVTDRHGQAYCGGERGQVEMHMMRPPIKLQPERTDLVERGVSITSVRCGGRASRNDTLVQLGEQYCCGLTIYHTVHCWGKPPPHNGIYVPREDVNPKGTDTVYVPFGQFLPIESFNNETNASVYHIKNRRCISRDGYLRDFGFAVAIRYAPEAISERNDEHDTAVHLLRRTTPLDDQRVDDCDMVMQQCRRDPLPKHQHHQYESSGSAALVALRNDGCLTARRVHRRSILLQLLVPHATNALRTNAKIHQSNRRGDLRAGEAVHYRASLRERHVHDQIHIGAYCSARQLLL